MADVRNFKPKLSSSRMFNYVKGQSKDFDDKKVDDKFYNYMTSSYETQDYLNDGYQFALTAPLIYQLDLLKEDIDDIHAHLSESKFTNKKQKFPVVDVTDEFYVTGTTTLEGDTTIEGFTNIKGAFKVNGSEISNLKPALEFSDSLRAKTIVSSSVQIGSDISGSFTNLSASIATDIGNAGGGTVDTALKNGSTNAVTNNAVFDGLALKLNLTGGQMTGPMAKTFRVLTAGSTAPNVNTGDMYVTANKRSAVKITTFGKAGAGQQITILFQDNNTTLAHNTKTMFLAGAQDVNLNIGDTIQLVYFNNIWYETSRSDNS